VNLTFSRPNDILIVSLLLYESGEEMSDKVKLIGFSGSLRKQSYNSQLLRECQRLLADVADVQIFDLGSLPFYNQDLDSNVPPVVVDLANEVRQAAGVILVTPEYNYSYSGVMKNMLEWLSRQCTGAPLIDKPAAVMGATLGAFGTTRGQRHLRDVLFSIGVRAVGKPEVCVSFANQKFDANGRLTDQPTVDFILQHLHQLIAMGRSS